MSCSVGQTIHALRRKNDHIEKVTVRKRPVHCALCNFLYGHHAMHPFYNTHGSEGLPYIAVNSQEEGIQWLHKGHLLSVRMFHATLLFLDVMTKEGMSQ